MKNILLLCLFIASLNITPANAGVNYFEVLGVSSNATDEEIKTAYRRLRGEWHPDRNPDPQAKNRFQEIKEAYEFLSNPQKRASIKSTSNDYWTGFTPQEVRDVAERMKAEAARRAQREATQKYYSQTNESIPQMAFHEFTREYNQALSITQKNPLIVARFSIFSKNHFIETLENLNSTDKSKLDAVLNFSNVMGHIANVYDSFFDRDLSLKRAMDINFVKMSLVQDVPAHKAFVYQMASQIKDAEDVRKILDQLIASQLDHFLRAAHDVGLGGRAVTALLREQSNHNLHLFRYMISSSQKSKFISIFLEITGNTVTAEGYLKGIEELQIKLKEKGQIVITQDNIQMALRKVPQNTSIHYKLLALSELVKEVETKNHQQSASGPSCPKFF